MALSDEQIDAVTLLQWGEMKGHPLAAHRAYARAIEAEVRKQDEALIRQMLGALEQALPELRGMALFSQTAESLAEAHDKSITAARLRLEGKP